MNSEIIAAIIGVAGAIIAGLIPVFIQHHKRRKEHYKARNVSVRSVTNPSDPDVTVALRLLERRIPEDERDSAEDIVRWLREVQDETKHGICKLLDFFLIAHIGEQVAGFAYVQFYPAFSLAFFSYLVVDDTIPEARECHVSTKLLLEIIKHLFIGKIKCTGVVIEVEEPAILRGQRKKIAEARIRHFRSLSRQLGFPLKTIMIDYTQPGLSVEDRLEEYRMRLMYAVREPSNEPRRITKDEVVYLLKFLKEAIYGDHFEHRADFDRKYRKYLEQWFEHQTAEIPDVVELS